MRRDKRPEKGGIYWGCREDEKEEEECEERKEPYKLMNYN